MSEAQRKGVHAERLAERMLRKEGWITQHAKFRREDYEGAELMVGDDEKVRDPDMLALRQGETVWVEVKEFEEPVDTKARGQLEHGVRKPKMNDYREIAEVSGIPVWLFIVEKDAGNILTENATLLNDLPPIDKEQCIRTYNAVVEFFARDSFTELAVSDEHIPEDLPFSVSTRGGEPLNDTIEGTDKTPPGYQVTFGDLFGGGD
jgi:hypothetical protein